MTSYRLGINTCFAVKRWPRPEEWARIAAEELGLDLAQHSLDLVDLDVAPAAQAAEVRGACEAAGLELTSTFTGLIAYSTSLQFNAQGRIDAARVLEAIEASGTSEVELILEVIPPFEQEDGQVLADLQTSVAHWRDALRGIGSAA